MMPMRPSNLLPARAIRSAFAASTEADSHRQSTPPTLLGIAIGALLHVDARLSYSVLFEPAAYGMTLNTP